MYVTGTANITSNTTIGGTLSITGAVTASSSIAATGDVTGDNFNISNWDAAYGWGDHSSAGYLTATQQLVELHHHLIMPDKYLHKT